MQIHNPDEHLEKRAASVEPIRLAYGTEELQFGDLYLPDSSDRHATVILIHGGYWRARYGLDLMDGLAEDLARRGYAAWNIEYRRVGDPGGGWPGTFQDIALATDHLRELEQTFALDLTKVVPIGHSAGGHLALWLAASPHIPSFVENSPIAGSQVPGKDEKSATPLALAGAISLAGVVDLEMAWKLHLSNDAVVELLGGTPASVPERYLVASPAALLPLGVPQVLIHGTKDDNVPIEVSQAYVNAARAVNDQITYIELNGVDHFDVINPNSEAWAITTKELQQLVN
jgi:acetyl esterase/lipase